MIRFILNENEINTSLPPGTVLLDFIRYHRHLMATKIGCREGDCGACTVLIGTIKNGDKKSSKMGVEYRSMTSCLVPLANVYGKHVVTIEGINFSDGSLNPVQQAMADEGATQCGFCTPGFVMSLAGFCLSENGSTEQDAVAAVDGNICRCTGYKSIERASAKIAALFKNKNGEPAIEFVTRNKILPGYFSGIHKRLNALNQDINTMPGNGKPMDGSSTFVSGGTDLYVQKHDELKHVEGSYLFDQEQLNGISKQENKIVVGPSATVTDLKQSKLFQELFPGFDRFAFLVSSTSIRNMATIAGNFVNASPIGDFSIFFLALNAQLELSSTDNSGKKKPRAVALRDFYLGYKQLNKNPEEFIQRIWFDIPAGDFKFNFEKLSKRTNLDIASVNTAILIQTKGDKVIHASLSAGGVAPVPKFLKKTSEFLSGKTLSEELVSESVAVTQSEVTPISDARGSADYKRFLLGQLIKAHFIELFPELNANKLVEI